MPERRRRRRKEGSNESNKPISQVTSKASNVRY